MMVGLTYSYEFLYLCRYHHPIRLHTHRPIPHSNTGIEPRRKVGIRHGFHRFMRDNLCFLCGTRDKG